MPKKEKRKPDKTKIKRMLKDHGIPEAKINGKKWDTDDEAKQSICELLGVTLDEYRRAGGLL